MEEEDAMSTADGRTAESARSSKEIELNTTPNSSRDMVGPPKLPAPIPIPSAMKSGGALKPPAFKLAGLPKQGEKRKVSMDPGLPPGTPPAFQLSGIPTSGTPVGASAAPTGVGFGDTFNFKGLTISPGPSPMLANGRPFIASLDDFRKIDNLGSGAHGEVWKVESISRGRISAMKQIELGLASKKKVQQIMRELNVLKKARGNPYIVDLHGVFYAKHNFYIIMQFMNSGSLASLLLKHLKVFKSGVPENVLAKIAVSTLQGLKFLKDELKVMHRDIKPSNILANDEGFVKICDFSICAEFQSHQYAETYIGTVYYMAPERINPRKDKGYNPTADIWSVGVTLAELATGSYPYPKEGIFDMLQHIVKGATPVERESFMQLEFSRNFVDFCTLCLQKAANDRPEHSVLLDHPFANAANMRQVVAEWIKSISEKTVV